MEWRHSTTLGTKNFKSLKSTAMAMILVSGMSEEVVFLDILEQCSTLTSELDIALLKKNPRSHQKKKTFEKSLCH